MGRTYSCSISIIGGGADIHMNICPPPQLSIFRRLWVLPVITKLQLIGMQVLVPEKLYKENFRQRAFVLEMLKFPLYFSGSCIPMNLLLLFFYYHLLPSFSCYGKMNNLHSWQVHLPCKICVNFISVFACSSIYLRTSPFKSCPLWPLGFIECLSRP